VVLVSAGFGVVLGARLRILRSVFRADVWVLANN
jgi:hypothetical protein